MGLGDRIGKFLELGYKETIHIVSVRVEASGGPQSGVKAPFSEAGKTFLPEVQAGGHQPHIPLLQGIVHHPLVLFHLHVGKSTGRNHSGVGAERLESTPFPQPHGLPLQRSHRNGASAVDQVASGLGGSVD